MAWLLIVWVGGSGCVSLSALPASTVSPATVTLPLTEAGIADQRVAFAALFVAEMDTGQSTSSVDLSQWLHGFKTQDRSDPTILASLRARFQTRAGSSSVLVIPGLFGDCVESQAVPFGDGVLRTPVRSRTEAYAQYADLGLYGLRSIALPGRRSSESNGRIVAEEIKREAGRPDVARVVLVAYSKGVPDTLHALTLLQEQGGIPTKVSALISVAGASMGTPIADHTERLYQTFAKWFKPFDCTASDGRELSSLTRRERVAWMTTHPLPEGLRYYSVTSFAFGDEVGRALRSMHESLSAIDVRNDGQLFTSDMFLPGSTLLAEARADHWDIALPRQRHPSPLWRSLSSGRDYPREALFRALIRWVIGQDS